MFYNSFSKKWLRSWFNQAQPNLQWERLFNQKGVQYSVNTKSMCNCTIWNQKSYWPTLLKSNITRYSLLLFHRKTQKPGDIIKVVMNWQKFTKHSLSQPTESTTMSFSPSVNLVEKYLAFQLKQQPTNG